MCGPANKRLQRTRSPGFRSGRSLRSLCSPLKRSPLGDVKLLSGLLVLILLGASPSLAKEKQSKAVQYLARAAIRVERVVVPLLGHSLDDPALYEEVKLDESQIKTLRDLLVVARRRNEAEEAEARRHGQVTGGVPGCVSSDFRVTFELGGTREIAWLHCGPGWLEGPASVGAIVFSKGERDRVNALLGYEAK
jgi:hypothetical protein